MQVQLYGHFSDYGSFSNVSRAFAYEIRKRRLQAAIYEIGTMFPKYLDTKLPIEVDSHAPIGIVVAYPPQSVGWLRGHTTRVLVTVCESDRVPDHWVAAANEATLVVVPSKFCVDAFKRSGLRAPIEIVHHGVHHIGDATRANNVRRDSGDAQLRDASRIDSATRMNSASQSKGDNRRLNAAYFLHVSGALSFPARKGTSQLLLAFKRLIQEYPVRLLLKMPPTDSVKKAISTIGLERYVEFVAAGETSDPQMMASLYRMVDAVVQPSRGEGFGLVPLEARCVGTPAIYTNDTGHREHFHIPSCPQIDTYESTLLLSQGNEHGYAPTVTVEAVYRAMVDFLENREAWTHRTEAWALAHAAEWTWSYKLTPIMQWLVREAMNVPPRGLIAGEDASLRGL